MKPLVQISLKVFILCTLLVMLQTAIIDDLFGFPVNLAFTTIIALATLTNLFEAVLASLLFISFSAMLSYDGFLPWIYLVIAIFASKFNPSNISDKFLVAIFFTLLLTPVNEIFNPYTSTFLYKVMAASIANVVILFPLYFVIKSFFKEDRTLTFRN